jgi:SWI/SNF-related matrix-associated actin-dependent regulator 1 of chromatin subfamily A
LYDEVENDLLGWLQGIDPEKMAAAQKAQALVKIAYLKRIAAQGKIKEITNWVNDFLTTKDKIVIFGWHKETLDAIDNAFKGRTVRLDGSTPKQRRQENVNRFQNDPSIQIFNGNLKSAGVGITLTAADTTCTIELGWNPGTHDQAEDRVHRIGQESDRVFAYYLLAQGTIEEKIAALLDKKRKIKTAITDGGEVGDEELLMELLKEYKAVASRKRT